MRWISVIPTDEGWLYLATVMDTYSRKIVGWSIEARMTQNLVLEPLEMAFKRRNPGPGQSIIRTVEANTRRKPIIGDCGVTG